MKNAIVATLVAGALVLLGGALWINTQTGAEQDTVFTSAQQSSANASGTGAIDKTDPRIIDWTDLLPKGEPVKMPLDSASDFFNDPSSSYSSSETGNSTNPLMSVRTPAAQPRQDLANTFVKLPGYMTPLNVDEGKTRSFLLVPYVGACIHVPAPPANQIVLVETSEPVEILDMWIPFEAIGTLRVESTSTDLAEVAYTMELDRMEPYVFEDETNNESQGG